MRRPRRRRPDHLVEVTIRCLRSEMRLVPTPERVEILGFSLAKAQARHPSVCLVALCQMSNHLHLVLRDGAGELSAFMQYFVGHLARRLNVLDGLHGAVFERRFSEIAIVDQAALVERVAYAIANPVEASLVQSHRAWNGLWAFAGGAAQRRSFSFFHAGRFRRACERVEGMDGAPRVRRAEFVETAVLEIGRVEAGLAAAIATAVKAREARLREGQGGVVGMARVVAMSPLERPRSSSRSPMPLCFASTEEGRSVFVAGWRAFVEAFHRASERFRRGVMEVAFPAGASVDLKVVVASTSFTPPVRLRPPPAFAEPARTPAWAGSNLA